MVSSGFTLPWMGPHVKTETTCIYYIKYKLDLVQVSKPKFNDILNNLATKWMQ